MHGRTSTAAVPRTKSLRADRMSAKQRRQEMANLIADGIARAVAARAEHSVEGSEKSEDSARTGLDLSASSPLSVHTDATSDRNESKDGEHE